MTTVLLPVDSKSAGVLILREFKIQDRNHPVVYNEMSFWYNRSTNWNRFTIKPAVGEFPLSSWQHCQIWTQHKVICCAVKVILCASTGDRVPPSGTRQVMLDISADDVYNACSSRNFVSSVIKKGPFRDVASLLVASRTCWWHKVSGE